MNTDFTAVYLFQIVVLSVCIYMAWHARAALNGLGRGLILLFMLLIFRRMDDILGYLDTIGNVILSSSVVVVVAYDIYQIYKAREVYALYLRNRRERISQLERIRQHDELNQARRKWDDDATES